MVWEFSIHKRWLPTNPAPEIFHIPIMKLTKILIILSICLATQHTYAQNFRLMRYDEDYSKLRADTANKLYSHLKYIPLTGDKKAYLSIGGEARLEFAAFDNEDWGKMDLGKNDFLLQRYDLHTDVHLSDRFRFFIQLRSALENGRKNGPRPIDEDQLNIQNLFADLKLWKSKSDSLTLRAGRQELNYGAGRLISVREGPNARLYFTGLKAIYVYKNLSADFFAMEADNTAPGIFDNHRSKQINLWGVYTTTKLLKSNSLDLYYIGYRKDQAVFDEGTANEKRHTLGARLWKSDTGFIYDIEAAYQFGKFGTENIRAWTASFDLGYSFGQLRSKPAFGIRNDYISGDGKKGDGTLGTFNPIYPKGGYFGFDPQVGPVNLIDIHPYGTIKVTPGLTLLCDVVFNWRFSLNDGIYRPSGTFNFSGSGSDQRYIGTAYLTKLSYLITPMLTFDFGMQYFKTGPFINSKIQHPDNALLTNTRIAFKF